MDVVTLQNLKKYFDQGPRQVKAIDGIDLSIEKGKFTAIVTAYFTELIGLLGLRERLDNVPYQLSGGGQQCTAIARALITKPTILLADEPTGSFDVKTSQNVAGLLKLSVDVFYQTLIMITHNLELAQLADRVVHLQDGHIVT